MPDAMPVPARSVELLLEEALELTETERARLATRLLESLEIQKSTLGHHQWIVEIEARARTAIAGQPGRSWAQARLEVLERLRW